MDGKKRSGRPDFYLVILVFAAWYFFHPIFGDVRPMSWRALIGGVGNGLLVASVVTWHGRHNLFDIWQVITRQGRYRPGDA